MKENDIKDYSKFIKELAHTIETANLSEIEFNHDLKQDKIHIKVKKNKEVPNSAPVFMQHAPMPTIPQMPATTSVATSNEISAVDLSKYPGAVLSPMVGVVYTSSNPDSEDFVKVGSTVNEGDTILLIEAMKVFTPVKAPKSGKVTQILVKSNQAIEYGEVLLIIE